MNTRLDILLDWVLMHQENGVERYVFDAPVRSVAEAIEVSGFEHSQFIKSICMKHKDQELYVIAIIPAGSKVDKRKLKEGIGPKRWMMTPKDEIQKILGFPAGGVPPVCINVNPQLINIYVDPRVLRKSFVIGGGGTSDSLLKLSPDLILKDGAVERIISFG